jgi:hypothetical protein
MCIFFSVSFELIKDTSACFTHHFFNRFRFCFYFMILSIFCSSNYGFKKLVSQSIHLIQPYSKNYLISN